MNKHILGATALCILAFATPALAAGSKAPVSAPAGTEASKLLERAGEGLRWPAPTQAQIDAAKARAAQAPESADAQFELAMAFARTCFLEEAWNALKQVQVLDASYADKVVERYGLATEADPHDLDARFRLALGYYFQGKKDLARQEVEHLTALAPQDPWPYNYLGFLIAEQNQLDLAQQNWQRALSLDPNNAVSHYLIGQVHYRQGRFMQAAQALAKAVSLRSGSAVKP